MRRGVWEAHTRYQVPEGATSRKLTCFAAKLRLANRTEWGEAIAVPYGAVIMIEDTHNGK